MFSATALCVLNRIVHDPSARIRYDMMSGGLMWSDEFPPLGTAEMSG